MRAGAARTERVTASLLSGAVSKPRTKAVLLPVAGQMPIGTDVRVLHCVVGVVAVSRSVGHIAVCTWSLVVWLRRPRVATDPDRTETKC